MCRVGRVHVTISFRGAPENAFFLARWTTPIVITTAEKIKVYENQRSQLCQANKNLRKKVVVNFLNQKFNSAFRKLS